VGAFVVWILTAVIAGHGLLGTLQEGLLVAGLLVVVGIGELFVITAGNGNIDLSIPYVMTLTAYLTSSVMNGRNSALPVSILIALAVGCAVGLVNACVIMVFQVPPLIATLAVGFIVDTVVLLRQQTGGVGSASPILVKFMSARVIGLPIFGVAILAVGVAAHFVLQRSAFGRAVQAVGQSREAARLVQLRPRLVTLEAYVVCGLCASLDGLLLNGYAGGPSLDMASTYQLGAIAVVVLGGSLIGGGKSNVAGVWAASLFLTFLVTLVAVTSAAAGVQDIVEGGVIVGVLALVASH
jgi:ribose transport system permease protein